MRFANHRAPSPNRAHGFTMLEVLISIVVIAFGMLGIAGLQAYALKNSQGASLRSIATVLASDMIDRMQANPVAATDGMYNEKGAGVAVLVPACLSAAGCTNPTQLASHDLAEWKATVAAALPKATAIVCIDSTIGADTGKDPGDKSICDNTGTQYVIYIWWSDDRNRGATTNIGRFATQFHI
jgi:type IV pilus assembly protein PilV